jgi:multiple sugar transport system substrate-binding protein
MTSRRRFTMLAGSAVVGLALEACSANTSTAPSSGGGGSGTGGGSGKTLNVYLSAQTSYPAQQKQWEARIAKEFKAQTGASVAFETYTAGTEEQQKIETSVVSGSGPDVYEIGTTFTPTAYASKSFVKVSGSGWAKVGGQARFTPSTLAMSGPSANDQIAVPFSSVPFVMAYNTKLFKAAGITSLPTTWDELIADAKKLTRGSVFGLGMDYKDSYNPWKYIWMFASQNGNSLVNGKTVTIADPVVAKAYETYFGFLTADKVVPPAAVNWAAADNLAAFAAGKVAMITMTTSGSLPTLLASPVKDDFAFATMPAVPPGATALPPGGVAATTIVSGQSLVVASYSSNQDLAFKYVDLITSVAEQENYSKVFGVLPTNAVAAKAIAAGNPAFNAVKTAGASAKPTPFTGAWSQIELGLVNVVVQSLSALSNGSVSPGSITSQLASLQTSSQTALNRADAQ